MVSATTITILTFKVRYTVLVCEGGQSELKPYPTPIIFSRFSTLELQLRNYLLLVAEYFRQKILLPDSVFLYLFVANVALPKNFTKI